MSKVKELYAAFNRKVIEEKNAKILTAKTPVLNYCCKRRSQDFTKFLHSSIIILGLLVNFSHRSSALDGFLAMAYYPKIFHKCSMGVTSGL